MNIDLYLRRLGYHSAPPPTLETLRELQWRHVCEFAFESLSTLLRLPVPIDLGTVERKILQEGRGGYCYELNQTFLVLLQHLGYEARGITGRVVMGGPEDALTARSHRLTLLHLDGQRYIADVGFDLYMRMVGEAVQDYKSGIVEGEEISHECKVELPINAHLSEKYVPGERLRLDLYRRLADVRNSEDVQSIREEMIDRFGELPDEANLLLDVAELRAYAKSLGIREVVLAGKYLRISPLTLPESKQLKLNRLFPSSLYKTQSSTVMVTIPRAAAWSPAAQSEANMGDTSLLAWVSTALDELTTKESKS